MQLDEKWSFVTKKQKHCAGDDDLFAGDQWDHVALDPDSRLVLSVVVGKRIVENAERVRSRPKARERTLELLTQAPLERASILHTTNADIDQFMASFMTLSKLDPSRVQLMLVGPSVGPHLGPGCVGGVVLLKH